MMKKITISFLQITALIIVISMSEQKMMAQNVGINPTGATANASALLDIDATGGPSLGLLMPRIALTAANVAAPVTSPAVSLLIYNTATASTGANAVSPGFYYWNGTKWVVFGGTPQGGIIMWSGLLSNIPAGWALCDGTLGTPNLLDRFILSVNTAENPGAIGGTHSYALTGAQLPAHNHTYNGTTSSDGLHNHTGTSGGLQFPQYSGPLVTSGVNQMTSTGFGQGTGYLVISPSSNTTSSNGLHNHTYSGTTNNQGTNAAIDNRPAYYKLAFIMKL